MNGMKRRADVIEERAEAEWHAPRAYADGELITERGSGEGGLMRRTSGQGRAVELASSTLDEA